MITQLLAHEGPVVLRFEVVRREFQRAVVILVSAHEITIALAHEGTLEEDMGLVASQAQRHVHVGACLGCVAQVQVYEPAVVPGEVEVAVDEHSAVQYDQGIVPAHQLHECHCAQIVNDRQARGYAVGALEPDQRFGCVLHLQGHGAALQ